MVYLVPFTDTTEARYAEIARKMVETNDWITPQFDYGVPFWGKPPLHTWLSAAGMKLFGVGHFGARIFIFLTGLGMMALLYPWVQAKKGRDYALGGLLVLASSALFFIAWATVMTDLVMIAGTSLSMIGFYSALTDPGKRRDGYLFFIGLAIGMLAKGPVAVVLTALPLVAWVGLQNRWLDLMKRLPWISGSLLAALICVPWYVAAELKTPGFLEYFFIGEHWHRFLDSGWKGDLYGNAHARMRGMIWLFWLLSFLPWSFVFVLPLVRGKRALRGVLREADGWTLYLLCWALSPMVFFTLATNILPTYVLSGIPAAAYLLIELWQRSRASERAVPSSTVIHAFALTAGSTTLVFASVFIALLMLGAGASKKSQKYLVERVASIREPDSGELFYWKKRYYSAEFYTAGRVRTIESGERLEDLLQNGTRDFLSVRQSKLKQLPEGFIEHFDYEGTFGKDDLYYEKRIPSQSKQVARFE